MLRFGVPEPTRLTPCAYARGSNSSPWRGAVRDVLMVTTRRRHACYSWSAQWGRYKQVSSEGDDDGDQLATTAWVKVMRVFTSPSVNTIMTPPSAAPRNPCGAGNLCCRTSSVSSVETGLESYARVNSTLMFHHASLSTIAPAASSLYELQQAPTATASPDLCADERDGLGHCSAIDRANAMVVMSCRSGLTEAHH